MKIAGIIAEYNPFHKGHAYHIRRTKELCQADYVVVAMSGDFVQRGAPAFLSRQARAKMALLGGADLVFELPSTCSCQSAEYFARYGVQLLQSLGCVDVLSFGCESGCGEAFLKAGTYLAEEPESYRQALKSYLKEGLSYPAARAKALNRTLTEDTGTEPVLSPELFSTPNNILAIEYAKALVISHSTMTPLAVPRMGNGYHNLELTDEYPSASAIRKYWKSSAGTSAFQKLEDAFCNGIFADICLPLEKHFLTEEDFSPYIRWMLYRTDSPEALAQYQDLSPDLARRLLRTRNDLEAFEQYMALIKTRELTYSRISRALFHALLDMKQPADLPYLRLLGFRKSAQPVLTEIKKNSTLPLLGRLPDAYKQLDEKGMDFLKENIRISNLYDMILAQKEQRKPMDENSRPMVILP